MQLFFLRRTVCFVYLYIFFKLTKNNCKRKLRFYTNSKCESFSSASLINFTFKQIKSGRLFIHKKRNKKSKKQKQSSKYAIKCVIAEHVRYEDHER